METQNLPSATQTDILNGKSVRHKQYSHEQYSRGTSGSGVECNVGMWEYENEKVRKRGNAEMGKCGA